MQIWVKEPLDDNPVPIYVNDNWVVGDLAIHLTTHTEFSFSGIQSKIITVQHNGELVARDVQLHSIENSARNPLIVFVNPDICKL